MMKNGKQYTKEEAIARAERFGLRQEVATAMGFGLSPDEALEDWDIYPFENVIERENVL